MLERWTIDSLANEIEAQFKGADPASKLLRKFFKEGKRHGKKATPPAPMKSLLENAVELATSKIAEDFLDDEKAAESNLAGMKARKAMIAEDLDEDDEDDAPAGPAKAKTSKSGVGTQTKGTDLGGALDQLRSARAAREAAAREAQHRAERDGLESSLDGVSEQIAVAEQELHDLPEKYRQLVESCHETGELMWARYCQGYVIGHAKRGVPDEQDPGPDDVEFEYPDVLDPEEEAAAADTPVAAANETTETV